MGDVDDLEVAATLGLGALSVVNPAFGVAAALFNGVMVRVNQIRTQRQSDAVGAFVAALGAVQDRIDASFVASDEYAGLVEEVMEKVNQRKEIDKRQYYAALLAGAAQPERPDTSEIERMIDSLGRLRPAHLWLLAALLGRHSWPRDDGSPSSFEREFLRQFPGTNMESVARDWLDLGNAGLVGGTAPPPMVGGSADNARAWRGLVTDYGIRFHQFVILPFGDVRPRKG